MKKLFWVTTPFKEEDWFIIANSAKEACRFHENSEGFDGGYAKAKEVCDVNKDYKKDDAYWAQLDMLTDLGFYVLSEAPYRILLKDGEIFQEGSTVKLVVTESSYEKQGLYIVNMAGTNMYKIGITKDFSRRLRNLQTGNPHVIEVHNFFPSLMSRKIESYLHNKYKTKKIAGEWFILSSKDLNSIHDDIKSFDSNC